MGIVSDRRRRKKARRLARGAIVCAVVSLLGLAAASSGLMHALPDALDRGMQAVQTFGQSAESTEITLPRREVFALQLGVFDSGERAASEAQRLQAAGVRCVVWQREKMRIVSSVALSRDALDLSTAKGNEAYVIGDKLEEVAVRIGAGSGEIAAVQSLLLLPDSVLTGLLEGSDSLDALIAKTEEAARTALGAHPENALYTQLAQSLMDWCALITQAAQEDGEEAARSYAAVTMHLICHELRQAISA